MEQQERLPLNYLEHESYALIGAFFEVYNNLGCGFLEEVYQESLEMELQERNIPFISQQDLQLQYKGKLLKHAYRPDLICFNQIIVELKAVKELDDVHRSQAINYAKVAGYKVALLINFGNTSLEFERFNISA